MSIVGGIVGFIALIGLMTWYRWLDNQPYIGKTNPGVEPERSTKRRH